MLVHSYTKSKQIWYSPDCLPSEGLERRCPSKIVFTFLFVFSFKRKVALAFLFSFLYWICNRKAVFCLKVATYVDTVIIRALVVGLPRVKRFYEEKEFKWNTCWWTQRSASTFSLWDKFNLSFLYWYFGVWLESKPKFQVWNGRSEFWILEGESSTWRRPCRWKQGGGVCGGRGSKGKPSPGKDSEKRIIRDVFLYWSEGRITLSLGVLGVTIQFSVFSVDTRTRAMRTTQPSPTTNTCGVLLIDSVAQWKWERESGQIWLEKVFELPQFGDVVHN